MSSAGGDDGGAELRKAAPRTRQSGTGGRRPSGDGSGVGTPLGRMLELQADTARLDEEKRTVIAGMCSMRRLLASWNEVHAAIVGCQVMSVRLLEVRCALADERICQERLRADVLKVQATSCTDAMLHNSRDSASVASFDERWSPFCAGRTPWRGDGVGGHCDSPEDGGDGRMSTRS